MDIDEIRAIFIIESILKDFAEVVIKVGIHNSEHLVELLEQVKNEPDEIRRNQLGFKLVEEYIRCMNDVIGIAQEKGKEKDRNKIIDKILEYSMLDQRSQDLRKLAFPELTEEEFKVFSRNQVIEHLQLKS